MRFYLEGMRFYLEGMRCLSRTSRMSWQMSRSSFSTWTQESKIYPATISLKHIFVDSNRSVWLKIVWLEEANSLPTKLEERTLLEYICISYLAWKIMTLSFVMSDQKMLFHESSTFWQCQVTKKVWGQKIKLSIAQLIGQGPLCVFDCNQYGSNM